MALYAKRFDFPAKLGQKIIITPEGAHKWKLNLYLDTRISGKQELELGQKERVY